MSSPYILNVHSVGDSLRYEVRANDNIDAMIKSGRLLLRLKALGLCKRYELLNPFGHGVADFREFMEDENGEGR